MRPTNAHLAVRRLDQALEDLHAALERLGPATALDPTHPSVIATHEAITQATKARKLACALDRATNRTAEPAA